MMKKLLTLGFLTFSALLFGQKALNTPWTNATNNTKTKTFQEITAEAEAYFNTIDVNKKGSGYKPYMRWKENWSKFVKPNGEIYSKEDLLKAWEEKRAIKSQNKISDLSNWTPIGPFDNSNTYNPVSKKRTGQGRINIIAVDPNNSNTYYVGTPAGGIWKSTNAGLDWKPLTDDLPQIGVSGIAIHPTNSNVIYIATGDDDAGDTFSVGVYKSIDGGTTWNPTAIMPGGNPSSMNEIYINPNSTETILVATSNGVMRSTNGGSSWSIALRGNIRDLKMRPNDSTTWYAVTDNQFFKSTNSGVSFAQITLPGLSGSARLTMAVTSADNNYVYVISALSTRFDSAFNGLFKSTNSGSSFTRSPTGSMFGGSTQAWYDLAIAASSNNPEIVYVGVLDIWKSINGGNSFSQLNFWNNPNQNSYTHADIHYLNFIDDKFFAGTDGGIYVSTDEGNNFTDLSKNLGISQFYRISVSPQNFNAIAGGIQDNGGYGLKNGEWKNYHGGDGMEGVVDPNNFRKYYGFTQFGGSLNISQNGGVSTITGFIGAPNNGDGGEWITPMSINKNSELYAGFDQLYKLENNSWSRISNHSEFNNGSKGLDNVEIDQNNIDNIYVSNTSSLFKSIDRGVTFESVPFPGGTINSIEVSNNDSNTIWIAAQGGVFKSINILSSNPTFTNITGNLPSDPKLTIKHHNRSGNNTIYLGTSLGVFFLNDNITQWETFDNGLPNTQIRDLAINEDDGKLIAATFGRSVFISDIPTQQLPSNDVRILTVNNPSNTIFNCDNNITPEITIKNQGIQAISSVTINFNIDGGLNNTMTWTGNLASEETTNITLPEQTNLPIGNHIINIETIISGDAFTNNNNLSTPFSINTASTNPIQQNTFEDASNNLFAENDNSSRNTWVRGNVSKTLLSNPEGSNSYATGLTGNYQNDTTSYLYSNCYDLTNILNPELAFKMAFDIEEEFDYMLVEYSTNFGASWQTLGSASDSNWYNNAATLTPQGSLLPGAQWTGLGEAVNPNDGLTNATVKNYSFDLSEFTNETNIIFRFKLFADQSVNEEGAVIDNLVINGTLSTDSFDLLNNIAIYPNPSESIFNINWTTGDKLDLKVFDITGKQVLSKKNISDNNYLLDLGSFSQGIYLLNLNMNGKTATKKLILK